MTIKVLSGTYATGYYLKSPVAILSITSTGYVEGPGVYTHAAAPNTYTVINNGKVAGGATGVYLSDGGMVTNGSVSDTTALIKGYFAIKLQQSGTVANYGSIISKSATGFGIYFNEPGLLTNGAASDTLAFIQGYVGVLMASEPDVAGIVDNFGTIDGSSDGAVMGFGGQLVNAAGATIEGGEDGVTGGNDPVTVTNNGFIIGSGSDAAGAGVYLSAGGTVTNGGLANTNASIVGYQTGLQVAGAAAVVRNYGSISIDEEGGRAAVALDHGGSVTNGAANDLSAKIVGTEGIDAENLAATVTNFGRIVGLGATAAGVELADGGVVTNGGSTDTAALIDGARGVDIAGARGTVTNFGTLEGAARAGYFGSPQYAAVNLLDGGILSNGSAADATALIEGYDGVLLAAASTATNLGTIQASGGYGIDLYGSSTLTNGSAGDTHALVGGWIGAELYGASTLTNFGTVQGAGGVAVIVGSAMARLNAEAGSVLDGQVVNDGGVVDFVSGAFTISVIQSSGTVEGAGTLHLAGGVSTFEAGAALSVASVIIATGVTTVDVTSPSLTFAKLWTQSAGTLAVAAADRINFSGAGDTFSGTLAGAGTVDFAGGTDAVAGATLKTASVIFGAATITLSGAIANTSSVTVSSPHVLIAAAGATLNGVGSINLSDLAGNKITGATAGSVLTNARNTITGAGSLGGGSMVLINETMGTIDANLAMALIVDTGASTITNAGLMECSSTGGLTIMGAIANSGALTVTKGALSVEGAVSGTGQVNIGGALADFAATFSQNVDFTSKTGVLELARSVSYAGHVSGFSKTGATSFDLLDIGFSAGTTIASFVGTDTSGVLTVTDGTHTAHITLEGNYTASTFSVASDGHGGTIVTDPTAVGGHAQPHLPLIAAMAGFSPSAAAATALPAADGGLRPALLIHRA